MRAGAFPLLTTAALAATLFVSGTTSASAQTDPGVAAIQQKYAELGGGGPLGDWADLAGGGKVARFAKWGTTVAITWTSGFGAHWFSGNINARWQPAFGVAVADQTPTQGTPGAAAGFANGVSIYYSDSTGARALSGPVRQKYWEMGHTVGPLGFPETDVLPLDGGTFAQFQNQISVFAENGAAPHWISGALRQRFWNAGSLAVLGFPKSDQLTTSGRPGYLIEFAESKTIYWSATTGAALLNGSTKHKYLELGGPAGPLGFPASDTRDVPGGTQTVFQQTIEILWSAENGVHWISGQLAGLLWNGLGGVEKMGFPTSDQVPTPGANGLSVLFGPYAAILWGPTAGAHLVSDSFLDRLRADGGVARYGVPQTGVLELSGREGWAFQQFEKASIFHTKPDALTVGWQIRSEWWRLGGYTGWIGLPTGNQYELGDRVEQTFEGGTVGCHLQTNSCYAVPMDQ